MVWQVEGVSSFRLLARWGHESSLPSSADSHALFLHGFPVELLKVSACRDLASSMCSSEPLEMSSRRVSSRDSTFLRFFVDFSVCGSCDVDRILIGSVKSLLKFSETSVGSTSSSRSLEILQRFPLLSVYSTLDLRVGYSAYGDAP